MALAAAGYVALVAAWLPHRHWDPDEFEHAQAAWLIAEGLTPFRDYFEHLSRLPQPIVAVLRAQYAPVGIAGLARRIP